MTELKAGPELNALVAEEVMGWVRLSMCIREGDWAWSLCDPIIAESMMEAQEEYHLALDGELPASNVWYYYAPFYSADMALARQVEVRIDELGLKMQYVYFLNAAISGSVNPDDYTPWRYYEMSGDLLWNMVHATPEERCIAALMAKRGSENT